MGALETPAELLFFLNPDAVPAPGCLDALREAPADWGAWQALVLQAGGELVNTRGNVVHFLGFGWAGGHDEPAAERRPRAGRSRLRLRRRAGGATRGVGRGRRLRTARSSCTARISTSRCGCGWQAGGSGCLPAARVEHSYEFDKGDYKWFHLERNRWWIVLGAYPAPLLALLAPALLLSELALLAIASRGGVAQRQAARASSRCCAASRSRFSDADISKGSGRWTAFASPPR